MCLVQQMLRMNVVKAFATHSSYVSRRLLDVTLGHNTPAPFQQRWLLDHTRVPTTGLPTPCFGEFKWVIDTLESQPHCHKGSMHDSSLGHFVVAVAQLRFIQTI